MKTLPLLLAAASFLLGSAASAADKVDVIVVTAKRPEAKLLSDMTDEIAAETADALRAPQPALAAPVRVEIQAPAPKRG